MGNIQFSEKEIKYLISILQDRYYKIANLNELSMVNHILSSLGESPKTNLLKGNYAK